MSRQSHWDAIYHGRGERDVSWFESVPSLSLELMEAAGLTPEMCVIDVGGGESRVVDALLARGLDCLAVLDVSGEALSHARTRIGARSAAVTWVAADVTGTWDVPPMDIWHDRAVFHFLTAAEDREQYVRRLTNTLKKNGTAIIATFALDGPDRCSGLPVVRYSPDSLATVLGSGFELQEARLYRHLTPWGASQSFQYSRFGRRH